MTKGEAFTIAERIAAGHALGKHVTEGKEFPNVSGREEFQELIFDVLVHPDEERPLARGRHAYWSEKHLTIVIVDSGNESNGTAFRPYNGREYFRSGLQ